jgi:hypothetical protein
VTLDYRVGGFSSGSFGGVGGLELTVARDSSEGARLSDGSWPLLRERGADAVPRRRILLLCFRRGGWMGFFLGRV